MDASEIVCAVCKKSAKASGVLAKVSKESGYICENCSTVSYSNFQKHYNADYGPIALKEIKKPKEIIAFLDEYVVGQEHAKKNLAVQVYQHYKRITSKDSHPDIEIKKSNVIMIGNSGTGKTLLAETLAKAIGVPFAIGDATSLTEAGYVGDDVESLILKLLQAANMSVPAAESGILFIDEIDKIRRASAGSSLTRDVTGEGVQRSLLKLVEGTIANVPPHGGRKHPEQKFINVNTRNILFIAGGAFNGLTEVVAKRQNRRVVGFGAEVALEKTQEQDKLISQVNSEDLIEYGFMPEMVGRFPVIVGLKNLTLDDILRILTEPKDALIKQYQVLVELDNCKLEFTKSALMAVAEQAIKSETGARQLRAVLEKVMLNIFLEAPENPGKTFIVDHKMIKGL